jgi:hypothetical protein
MGESERGVAPEPELELLGPATERDSGQRRDSGDAADSARSELDVVRRRDAVRLRRTPGSLGVRFSLTRHDAKRDFIEILYHHFLS